MAEINISLQYVNKGALLHWVSVSFTELNMAAVFIMLSDTVIAIFCISMHPALFFMLLLLSHSYWILFSKNLLDTSSNLGVLLHSLALVGKSFVLKFLARTLLKKSKKVYLPVWWVIPKIVPQLNNANLVDTFLPNTAKIVLVVEISSSL